MDILPCLLLFELSQRLLYLSISLVCVYILSLKRFSTCKSTTLVHPVCNVLKYYWWLSIYSVAPPSSSRSLLASLSTVHRAGPRRGSPGQHRAVSPREYLRPFLHTTSDCPATRQVGARRLQDKTRKQCSGSGSGADPEPDEQTSLPRPPCPSPSWLPPALRCFSLYLCLTLV